MNLRVDTELSANENMCNLGYWDFIYFSGKGNDIVIQSTPLPKPGQEKAF